MKVGLTGGLAAGKSTVARWFADAGFTVVDADELVAGLYQAGKSGAEAVADIFGPEVLDSNGNVDHAQLAERVFADGDALEILEERIHPLVREEFSRLAAKARGPVVLEATLLVEAGYAPDFDLVVTVEANPELRVERAVRRGLSEQEARARLEAQADREFREKAAHRILVNDATLEDLRVQVDRLVGEIRATAPTTSP